MVGLDQLRWRRQIRVGQDLASLGLCSGKGLLTLGLGLSPRWGPFPRLPPISLLLHVLHENPLLGRPVFLAFSPFFCGVSNSHHPQIVTFLFIFEPHL